MNVRHEVGFGWFMAGVAVAPYRAEVRMDPKERTITSDLAGVIGAGEVGRQLASYALAHHREPVKSRFVELF